MQLQRKVHVPTEVSVAIKCERGIVGFYLVSFVNDRIMLALMWPTVKIDIVTNHVCFKRVIQWIYHRSALNEPQECIRMGD